LAQGDAAVVGRDEAVAVNAEACVGETLDAAFEQKCVLEAPAAQADISQAGSFAGDRRPF
jgi:hypothetical protein